MTTYYHHTYTGKDRAYVRVNMKFKTFKELAAHIGVSDVALRRRISDWRKQGYNIPFERRVPVGTITMRNRRGKPARYLKTETGWKCLDAKPRGVKQPALCKARRKERNKKVTSAIRRPAKPVEAKAIVARQQKDGKWVKVDSKTWKFKAA